MIAAVHFTLLTKGRGSRLQKSYPHKHNSKRYHIGYNTMFSKTSTPIKYKYKWLNYVNYKYIIEIFWKDICLLGEFLNNLIRKIHKSFTYRSGSTLLPTYWLCLPNSHLIQVGMFHPNVSVFLYVCLTRTCSFDPISWRGKPVYSWRWRDIYSIYFFVLTNDSAL